MSIRFGEKSGGVVQDYDAHAYSGLGELAFAFRAALECRATFLVVFVIFICFTVADARICIYRYTDECRKPENREEDIENGKGVGVSETLCSLKGRYGGLVDEDRYTEPALHSVRF